ncbi:SDR family oxidoreductase [Sphingomonas sp.]|uniref:SDR family oxidoreductase n=1 Tax=Sphingomonas sp. TaxID=28214 RepID=UPI002BA46084|nr:SDR family oxidoreductase [Sphingomonas sp.]HTG38850.1 SDR family oxidoreductase [Sphingomonas sp.]
MKIFVTGATGFVGAAVVDALLAGGHEVIGLARSDAAAAQLTEKGAAVQRGELTLPDGLGAGVEAADAVIHTGMIHDFARFAEVCALDRATIAMLGDALEGTDKPLLVTSGTPVLGRIATEDDVAAQPHDAYPRASERAVADLIARGIRAGAVRLPPSVHGAGDHAFVPILIDIARRRGVSAFIGDGANRWSAVHRADAGMLFRLAIEDDAAGSRYHAHAETGVAMRDIAVAIGAGLNLPVQSVPPETAADHFGWFAAFAASDFAASSERTRQRLNWMPQGPGLIEDIARAGYFD